MIPQWVDKYIGIPYSEFDCLCLFKHIYEKERGIIIPNYDNHKDCEDIKSIEKEFYKEKDTWLKIDNPEPLCLIMINIFGHPIHIGMCLDNNFMIHTLKGHNSGIEKYTSLKWKNRIEGFYKWPSM